MCESQTVVLCSPQFKMESYLLFTNTSPQECSRKGFTLPQAAQFHLSGGIDKTKPISPAKATLASAYCWRHNIHIIYGLHLGVFLFGIIKFAKGLLVFDLIECFSFYLFLEPQFCPFSITSWMTALMSVCKPLFLCNLPLLCNIYALQWVQKRVTVVLL